MTTSLMIMHSTIVLVFILAIRIKLWQKSITMFSLISLMLLILVLYVSCTYEMFMKVSPILVSVYLLLFTFRAILKDTGDRILGGLKWEVGT